MSERRQPIRMVLSITIRGQGRELIERLEKRGCHCHFQCVGRGTASSEMLDLLGLSNSDKDILFSLGTKDAVDSLIEEMSGSFPHLGRGKGLMMAISLNAINSMMAMMLLNHDEDSTRRTEDTGMKTPYRHSLICLAVNQGYTDQVMQTAREAGAAGGTVIRARMAGTEQAMEMYGINLSEEKELVLILCNDDVRNAIMDAVNRDYGLSSPAQTIQCAVPVDRAFKL